MRVETKYSGSQEEVIIDSKEGREVNRKKKEFTVYSVCTHDKGLGPPQAENRDPNIQRTRGFKV